MESINLIVIIAAAGMIAGIIMFIKLYNSKTKANIDIYVVDEDVFKNGDVQEEDCCGDEECVCHDTQAPVKSNMMKITSTDRVKVKTRIWLLTNGFDKKEIDGILENSKPFDATDMDISTIPFKYEWL